MTHRFSRNLPVPLCRGLFRVSIEFRVKSETSSVLVSYFVTVTPPDGRAPCDRPNSYKWQQG
jgi:hypothetical protein